VTHIYQFAKFVSNKKADGTRQMADRSGKAASSRRTPKRAFAREKPS
jgi:hypothetical protein